MPKPRVAIYGLTTEGYNLASRIVDKSAVTIVDETLQMAMDLNPAIVKTHSSLSELVGGETLMGLKPVSQVLSEASVIFLAPKLRKTRDESMIEANAKLRELAKFVSRGATIVNMLPTGVGGNADNIGFLEKQTGLKVGETLNYAYCPLKPRGDAAGVTAIAKARDFTNLSELGLETNYGNLTPVELDYVSATLAESTSAVSEIELMRKAREQKALCGSSGRFIDGLASYAFDLTAIQASDDVGEPITYLAGAALKGLENYARYVVDDTRELLREMQLKASRTRVIVAWTIDRYEMRADRSHTAEALVERLRDYVTDVQHVQANPGGAHEIVDTYKHNIAIVCSAKDYEWVKGLRKGHRSSELSIVKGTASLQRE